MSDDVFDRKAEAIERIWAGRDVSPRMRLEAARDVLICELELSQGRDVAQLVAQLQNVEKQLAGLPADKKASIEDELASRRTRADVSDRAEGGGVRRQGGKRTRSVRRSESAS